MPFWHKLGYSLKVHVFENIVPTGTLPARWGMEHTYRFRLGGVEQVFEGFVCCPQQRPDRTGPFLSVFFSSLFRIVAQECTKEARVGVLHQFHLHRSIQALSYGRRYQLNMRINIQGLRRNKSFLRRAIQPLPKSWYTNTPGVFCVPPYKLIAKEFKHSRIF